MENTEIRIVFDGPPAHESGRFIEVEDVSGKSIRVGEWHERQDGLWELRISGVNLEADAAARRISDENQREETLAGGQFGVGA